AGFDEDSGKGIAIQIDVEDAVGVAHQVERLKGKIEEEL
ncbi:MAG: P-II family nitrogen regulator, partial [Colwellia sp.]|nr:P-II family nitrogen regulator [Colwellia sp.]